MATASEQWRRVANLGDEELEDFDPVEVELIFQRIDSILGKRKGKPIPPPPGSNPEFDEKWNENESRRKRTVRSTGRRFPGGRGRRGPKPKRRVVRRSSKRVR